MRLLSAVVLMVAMLWMMLGCGMAIAPAAGGATNELMLVDSGRNARYTLGVTGGALTLTGAEGAGFAADDAGLIDGKTGACYSLRVDDGALTLVRGTVEGVAEIGLKDTVTAQTYELAVVSGALTLTAQEAGAK